MADQIGVSASYYYKIEAGQLNPSFTFMEKFKKAFPQVSLDEMFFQKKY